MSPAFTIELDGERFKPGGRISGTVRVTEGGKSRSLEAFLLYREATRDYNHTAVSIASGPLHQGPLEAGNSYRFELAVPADALPAASAGNSRLWWEIDVKSDEFGSDTHERREITLEDGPG